VTGRVLEFRARRSDPSESAAESNPFLFTIITGGIAVACALPLFSPHAGAAAVIGLLLGCVLSLVSSLTSLAQLVARPVLRRAFAATLLLNLSMLFVHGFYVVRIIRYFAEGGC
jgi:hypothetical protein